MSLTADGVAVSVGSVDILEDVSITVGPCEVTGLIGPNGAGKSTFLRALSGDTKVNSGSVSLNGRALSDFSTAELAKRRAVMSQFATIVFDFTVEEIIRMGWTHDDQLRTETREQVVSEVVSVCDLQKFMTRRYRTLSGGEQRRVQFARTLLQVWPVDDDQSDRYLMLDEPTANLDLRYELETLKLARSVSESNVGALIVLHDLNLAARFTDRLALMHRGQIVMFAATEEVLSNPVLGEVYEIPIQVEHHDQLNRVVVHT